MAITTKDIIKRLPFGEDFKTNLLNQFDLLNPDQKFNLEQIVWDTYDAIFELRLQQNIKLGLLKAENNEEKLDQEFYKRIREQTEKEMEQEAIQTVEKVDLSAARKAMETIIAEIRAAKKTPTSV